MFSLKGPVGRELGHVIKEEIRSPLGAGARHLTPGENKQRGVASVFEGSQDKGLRLPGELFLVFYQRPQRLYSLVGITDNHLLGKITVLELKIFCSPYGLEVSNSEMGLA